MKIMSHHNSASERDETPHTINSTNNQTINDATIDCLNVPPTSIEKIEALVDIICGTRRESPAALLVLMATLANASEPQALAHAAKHIAFTRCGELNLYDMVDGQIARLESELLAANSLAS
jgi:hypothetical protein